MKSRIATLVILILAASGLVAGCAGMDLGDIIEARTPPEIQQKEGLSSTLSINEAESRYEAWIDDVQRVGAEWKGNIEKGNQFRAIISQLTLNALDNLGPAVAGVPVLAPALPAIGTLAGWFLGTGNTRKQKEKSYNAGIELGKRTAVEGGQKAATIQS